MIRYLVLGVPKMKDSNTSGATLRGSVPHHYTEAQHYKGQQIAAQQFTEEHKQPYTELHLARQQTAQLRMHT